LYGRVTFAQDVPAEEIPVEMRTGETAARSRGIGQAMRVERVGDHWMRMLLNLSAMQIDARRQRFLDCR
jgi:hypothetical protein